MIRTACLLTSAALMLSACQQPAPNGAAKTETGAALPQAANPAGKKWSETVRKTPEGGFVMGNPDAKVKLVEYGSLTCSHCAEFNLESEAELVGKYVNSGQVSYEFRNFMLNAIDLSISTLASCGGEARFFPLMSNVFAGQNQIFANAQNVDKAAEAQINAAPPLQRPLLIAKALKIDEFFKARGFSDAEIQQCLTNPDNLTAMEKTSNEGAEKYKIQGTPTFIIDGKAVEMKPGTPLWAQLKPMLDAKLK